MNFYSSRILSVITYIIFNIFLPPPHFYSKYIILIHKIPHILRILTLSFYDNYYELEVTFFSFFKTKSTKRKCIHKNSNYHFYPHCCDLSVLRGTQLDVVALWRLLLPNSHKHKKTVRYP